MMEEIRISEGICAFLSGMGGDIPFLPEVWRDGCASVWLSGGGEILRSYVDGSAVAALPFEIRLRCAGTSIVDRLDALAFFRAVGQYIRANVPEEWADAKIECTAAASKSAVFENGEEEYRAAYRLCYFTEKM